MLPKELSYADRFALARDGRLRRRSRCRPSPKPEEAAEINGGPEEDRIEDSLGHEHGSLAGSPLSSSDPQVVSGSVKGMETSLRNAALWGAETVLLVPAVVDATTSYKDAYTRSQRVIRERLLPIAKDTKVVIAVEEVWNKFLLSPIEFARYVDEFESPLAAAPTSTSATSCSTRSRRTGFARWVRASSRCT